MKRIILLLVLVSLSFFGLCQNSIKLAFTGSPSINWIKTDNINTQSEQSSFGYDFGINGDYFFSPNGKYAVSVGVLITNTGGEISYHLDEETFSFADYVLPNETKIKYRLRYVEIPTTIKLKTSPFRRFTYWGQCGFSSFINIEARGDSNDGTLKKTAINEEVQMFNFALNVGLGFDYDLGGNNSVSLGLVLKNGFTDITSNDNIEDQALLNSLKLKVSMIF